MGSAVVLALLALAVGLALRQVYRRKKRGGCHGSCAACPGCGRKQN